MTFSEKILSCRKKAGLSQEALAERLGVSRQAISRWEMGNTIPDAENLLQLSQLFGVSVDYLLHDEQGQEPSVPSTLNPSSYAMSPAPPAAGRGLLLFAVVTAILFAILSLILSLRNRRIAAALHRKYSAAYAATLIGLWKYITGTIALLFFLMLI